MTSKEKKLKTIIELVAVTSRIEELKRSKSYLSGTVYYRNRLTVLEEKAEKLQDVIDGRETEKLELVFQVPESLLLGKREPEDLLQFFKREFLVVEG